MKIHPVNHAKGDINRYCGPSAISIVTGMASGEAARLIRATSQAKQVQGTSDWQMKVALAKCGITMRAVNVKPQPAKIIRGKTETRPTLTQWYRDTQALRSSGRVFLVSAGYHWQIITGRRFCCGRVKAIVSITAKGTNRRARVDGVYELTATDRIAIPAIAKKPKASSKVHPARKALAAIEKAHGFKGKLVQWDRGFYDYTVEAHDDREFFRFGFTTMHHDWFDTLERVRYCLDPEVYAGLADDDYHYSE